ncbi:mitochondrial single stranded DNA-binding protein [Ptiloglossa arizonensis]|uniref:mitochondrial single stranded DNA-binding protein n=1 Tax=Ptiloglossa arizonensis TaxID=3350558 RepID=UPI003F9EFBE3
MFQRVISKMMKSIPKVNCMRMTTTPVITKLEKTMNQIIVLGRVGNDPQKRGSLEHPVVMFSVATHSNYKYMNGDFAQRTDWHKICVFQPNLRDNVISYLKKGQRVMVTGKISYSEFTDEAGNVKPSTAIIADEVVFFYSAKE